MNVNVNFDVNVVELIEYLDKRAQKQTDDANLRQKWLHDCVTLFNKLGYNCACGTALAFRNHSESRVFIVGNKTIRVGWSPQNAFPGMEVRNGGEYGYDNWCFGGRNWVRWDETKTDITHVKFHAEWYYESMGTPYERRVVKNAPDFFRGLTWYG